MDKPRALLTAFLYIGFSFAIHAQSATPNQIPELEQKLAATTNPAEKAALCNELSYAWQRKDLEKGVQYAEDARTLAEAAGEKRELMKALNLLGDAAIRQRNLEQAGKYYQEALELAQKTENAEMEGRALHNKGKLAQTMGQPEEALVFYEQAYQIRERINDQQGLSSTTQNLGVLYTARADYEKSIFYYQKALQLKEASGDRAGAATVQANLANNYTFLGRFSDAELLLRAAIETNTALDNKRGLAQAYMNLSTVLSRLGQQQAAIEALVIAKTLFLALDDKGNVIGVLNNLGQIYTEQAQYAKAQEVLLEALKTVEGVPANGELMYLINMGLGRIKGYQSLFKEELSYYAKAIAYAGNDLERTTMLQAIAAAQIGDLQFEKGLATALEGAALAREKGFRDREADCLNQAASALLNLNRLKEALKNIDAAIALGKKTGYQVFIPAALVTRSRIVSKMNGDKEAILASAMAALKSAQKLENPLEEVHAWEELSEAYRKLNETDKALEALKKAQLLRDSIFSKQEIRTLAVQEKDYEFDKERAEQELEQQRAAVAAEAALTRQRQQRNAWIIGLSLLLFGGFGYFLYWRNRQQTRAQLREAETRQRIARDLHDDVGSTLSSISILSAASGQTSLGEKARQAMESMDDVVWSVNPANDSMENVLQRMKEFSVELFESQGIALHFQADEAVKTLNLPMEQRKDFYLLFKEAANNAAKYSGASEVWVLVQSDNGGLRLEVRDNGRGFDPATVKQGNGLWNMQRRAERMGGQLALESRVGEGTRMLLALVMK
ncbi:MAG: tetratricopeptide repeat protein [Saprospiraceae bacterium]|nr:tetratricopeptide repeat protein [Saprospiraceae bacterium]